MILSSELIIFSGNSNKQLSNKIALALNTSVDGALVSSFADGETRVEILRNVRGSEVFIIQPTCAPANHNLMEALIMVDACKRASAKSVTLVMPYFGYARQERKSSPRTPISARLAAELIEAAGTDRVLTFELHNSAIQGFFRIPVDHLFVKPVFFEYFSEKKASVDLIVISPDAGGVERARAMAKVLKCGLAIIDKRRDRPNESTVMHLIGDVSDKDCLIIDDIVDTGGSLIRAAEALMAHGAKSVSAAITHPVLSSGAVEKIASSKLSRLVVTDSIPLSDTALKCEKIIPISIAPLMGEAIHRIHDRASISSLFL